MKNKLKKINLNIDIFAKFLGFVFVVFTPLVLFAQNNPSTSTGIGGLFDVVRDIISGSLIPLIFSLAFVYFIWGVVQYVLYPDDEAKKTKGRQYMIWGLIALTVMFSVWGLVNILGNTFGILGNSSPKQPQLPI